MINEFFAYARERHLVHLRRSAGEPAPWTDDPVLQQYRFCNVFRELDATTQWFAGHVRGPLKSKTEVLLATVLFRLFNRISTGEAIFLQGFLDDGRSAWDKFLADGDLDVLRAAVLTYCGRGPYVTGSFMVKTPTGLDKLDGVLWIVEQFANGARKRDVISGWTEPENSIFRRDEALLRPPSWREIAEELIREPYSLEQVWRWLRQFPFIGDFQAYEIVTDLRWTDLLNRAPDIHTWANPGPGCKRGLNWVFRGDPKRGTSREGYLEEMQALLALSRDPKHWPADWPAWEMREVEHVSCETDKKWRTERGGPPPRQRFRHG